MIKDKYLINWIFSKNRKTSNLTDKQFYELLECIEFDLQSEVLKNGIEIFYLTDKTKANLSNIEQDVFYIDNQINTSIYHIRDLIVQRLEIYIYDYFIRDKICID